MTYRASGSDCQVFSHSGSIRSARTRSRFLIVLLVLLGWACCAKSASALDIPLGGIGGVGDIVPGTGLVSVTSVTAGGPGALAGLQPGDLIQGANGILFSPTSADTNMGYVGALQDLAMAVDRAEGGSGALSLQVIRSGVGGMTLNLNLSPVGALGPAWPANTGKTASMFEWSCDQIHAKVQASATGDFGYNSGWFGMILLAHPDWNQTSGANPFRNSINKLRTRCENYINGRVLEPAEAYYWNGSNVVANPAYVDAGLENWDVCSSAMFLALYRTKTGDTTANAVVQRAAEAIAHRIQHWSQYDDPGIPHVLGGGIGRMGHNGVVGDYSHYDGIGALNIINAHALPALALLKNAGANMNTNLGLSINAFTYNTGLVQPTIEQKFRMCWDYVKAATSVGGGDDGNVGYVTPQSGWDSAARTPGCFAGWKLYGMTANTDDTDKIARQADYFTRFWFRQQNAHAYTVGGVVLSQLAMPFLDYRRERFFQENTRLYAALARQPDGSIAYFPGRQNIGGDGYLNYNNVALINAAMPVAIRTGNLPGFAAPDSTRIHAWMRSPVNSWPSIAARRVVLTGGLSHALDLDITDANGTILAPANYTAAWTHVSGPSTVTFGSPALADTTVTVSQAGTYRVNLQVTRGAYVLNEPYDLVVSTTTPPPNIPPSVVTNPVNLSVDQGSIATFSVVAQGTAPLIYQWRRNGVPVGLPSTDPSYTIGSVSAGSAGTYDCVITNVAGTVTSASATLVVNGVGTFRWGGLWRDVFTGISGSSVSNLTSSANYPLFPDASGVITNAESPSNYADNYGQRWSGWITPPQTGNYRFYIACDDHAELWISTDNRRANRVLRAKETGYRTSRDWPTVTTDESVSPQIALVAGQRYYIELLHKEGGGGDNAAITWDWRSTGVWANPTVGSVPLPGAILEYQEGGTVDDNAHPPANYAPIAVNQSFVVFGGASTPVQLTGQDFENSPLTYSVITNPTKGTLSGTVPNLIYTPFPGASGVDSFTFKVYDGSLYSEEAGTVTLSLIPESGTDLKIWDGSSSTLWTTAANWKSSVVPDANDAVIFNGDSLSNLATSLGANRTISRIVVIDPAGPVSIGDNTLTLSGGIDMLAASADLTISSLVSISAAQEWSVGAGRTLLKNGALSGTTAITKTGPGTLEISGPTASGMTGGIIVNEGTLRLSGGVWYGGCVGGTGTVTVNQGAVAINVNSHAFGSTNDPNRDIILNGGSFLFANGGTYVDDVTCTAGLFANTVGGSGGIQSRSGNNSVFTVNASAQPTVVDSDFVAVGSWAINVADGAASNDLVINGPITNSGAITKSGAGRMSLTSTSSSHTGGFTVSAGEVAVTGVLASGMSVQSAGTLSGIGTVQGTVNQSGIISPGLDGIGGISLGVLSQTATATTFITLNGTNPGNYDRVAVVGAATLAGTLQVTLQSGFTPAIGDVFDIITCVSRTGTFSTINLPTLPSGREWVTTYDGGPTAGLRLSVVTASAMPSVAWTTASQSSVSESGTMTVTAQLSATSTQNVTVPFTVTGTSAAGDRTISASPITIVAGATTASATITITADTLDEPNETVILTMGTPTNATPGTTTVHTATITDDDAAPTVAWTAASQASVGETGTMTVTAQLSAASGRAISVPFTVTGTSAAGDRTITASPISIAAGAMTGTATITITADTLDETNETVILTMGTPTNATLGATTVHTATITDDDATPTVAWTAASQTSAGETGTMTVTAQLSAASGRTVSVPFTVTGTSVAGDRTITASPISIAAGATTGTATITITADTLDESNETVILTMGTPTNATLGATTVHTATITDDDATPTVAFAVASSSGGEATATVNVPVSLSAASGQTVTVSYAVSGGTATGGGVDYTLASGTLTFTTGVTTQNITITVANDALNDGNETIQVTLSSPSNATLGATTTHTYTIIDDDSSLPTVAWTAASQASVGETGTLTVTAQLSATSASIVTVPFTVTGTSSAGDRTLTASPISIAAGATTGTATITITADTLDESNETVILTMGTPTNATLGATTVHTATITDDDAAPTVAWTAASQSSVGETGTMTVTAQLSAASGQAVSVPFTVTGTSATGDRTITASPISIAAGATTGTATITITADTLDESNETVILTMGTPTNATLGATTVHTATITDDDAAPTVAWTAASQASVGETGTMTVTAQLSAASGQAVSVPFTVTGTSTAGDRTITASPISIAAGATTGTATITITADTLDESNETVILTMGTPTNATLGATTVHTATITDDDAAPTVAWTAASQTSAGETGTMTVTAQLSAASGQTVTVPFTVTGTSVTGDRTITASPISIAAGATTGTATITITADTLDESNETVILTMGTPTNATLGATTVHTATITDDDATPTVAWTAASQSSVNESGTLTVTAQLSAASGQNVTVPFALTGTATSGSDYTITASPITITAGATTGAATITIIADALAEGNETVILTIGTPTNATLGATTVHTATITEPLTFTSVALTPLGATVVKSGTVQYTAKAKDQFGADLAPQPTFTWSTSGGGTIASSGLFTSTASGTFTITAQATSGGITKSGTTQVTVTEPIAVKINFQPATAPTVAGYLVDSGLVYADRGNGFTYGWNADISNTSRDRNLLTDQLRDTLLYMQKRPTSNASWEIAVPNGLYQVLLVCGDARYYDSIYQVNIEGVLGVSGTPTTSTRFIDSGNSFQVQVNDGRLTLTNGTGAVDNKVCFIEIVQVPVASN